MALTPEPPKRCPLQEGVYVPRQRRLWQDLGNLSQDTSSQSAWPEDTFGWAQGRGRAAGTC